MTLPIPAYDEKSMDAFLAEFAWYLPVGNFQQAKNSDVNAWFVAADAGAMYEQVRLRKRQKLALCVALVVIVVLASSAVLLGNPVPQLLCPVTVFLMILYLDKLRQSAVTFRFTALRHLAETLRVAIAVGDKPGLREYVLLQRGRSTHAVLRLTSMACMTVRDPFSSQEKPREPVISTWDTWLKTQQDYFQTASLREKHRSTQGKYIFNVCYCAIGSIAIGAGMWAFMVPSATSGQAFRVLLAAVAALGSMGLSVINYVRERKAFDQSIDYAHMDRQFQGFNPSGTVDCSPAEAEEALVSASLDEHGRWAIRMAGHFAERPVIDPT